MGGVIRPMYRKVTKIGEIDKRLSPAVVEHRPRLFQGCPWCVAGLNAVMKIWIATVKKEEFVQIYHEEHDNDEAGCRLHRSMFVDDRVTWAANDASYHRLKEYGESGATR